MTVKFRALGTKGWSPTENNGWYYGTSDVPEYTLDTRLPQHFGLPRFFKDIGGNYLDKSTLSQYINFNDANNVEIYEGDIVTGKYNSNLFITTPVIGVVCRSVSNYDNGYVIKQITVTDIPISNFYTEMGMHITWDNVTVIGNVYENPELLEEL